MPNRKQEKSLRASRLKSSDRRMVREMLQDVRMKFEKPTWAQDATEARYMEPFVYQELTLHPAAEDSYLNRKITVVCFPFFLLDEPPKDIEILSRTNHPPLTLLQTLSSSMGLERDMQQVVCDSSIGQKSRCFYVSQLWGIIVDDSKCISMFNKLMLTSKVCSSLAHGYQRRTSPEMQYL